MTEHNTPPAYKCGHCMQVFANHGHACAHHRAEHWVMSENLYVEHLDDDGRIIWSSCDFTGKADLSKPPIPPASTEGRKDDSDKLPLDLIPPELLFAVAEILDFGAKKYGAYNWSKGMAWSRVYGALMRHMWAWWSGDGLDKETGKSHLWHAGCCIAFLIAYEARKTGTDDRPTS